MLCHRWRLAVFVCLTFGFSTFAPIPHGNLIANALSPPVDPRDPSELSPYVSPLQADIDSGVVSVAFLDANFIYCFEHVFRP